MASDRIRVIHKHLLGKQNLRKIVSNETSAVAADAATYMNFRYTLNNPLLSWREREFYENNGYILIPKLIEPEVLEKCRKHFVDLCNGTVPKGNIVMMKDISLAKTNAKGEYLYNKAQDIIWDDMFLEYFRHSKLLDYVECFTGPNIMGVHSMLINKPPDSGKLTSTHPLHQDLHYFPFRPADRIVAAWTAMEKVTYENGCLVVIPGSHRGELLSHSYPKWEHGVNKAYHGIQGYDHVPTVKLEMEKGDTAFFHPLLIHGSGPNLTKGFRKAISCHYAASDCHYIDVRGTSQQSIADEVVEMAQKRGFESEYQDFWKVRSRLVRGEEISL